MTKIPTKIVRRERLLKTLTYEKAAPKKLVILTPVDNLISIL